MSTREVPNVRLVDLVPTMVERARGLHVIRVGARSVEVDERFDETTLRRDGGARGVLSLAPTGDRQLFARR